MSVIAAPLRVATAGSVDDGKSTLIGRLLYDTRKIHEDQLIAVEKHTQDRGGSGVDLALFTDGLKAEREQGITIDVAYRYFATERRKFILADTPGHEQYTRNMVTGASTSDAAIVLVDARHGLTDQTRRHLLIASLLGIRHIVVAVNKMDLVGFDQGRFAELEAELRILQARLGIDGGAVIPVSALGGDNLAARSSRMEWYLGEALLPLLESLPVQRAQIAPRFAVQWVCRVQDGARAPYRAYTGRLCGGGLNVGDELMVASSGERATLQSIDHFDGARGSALPGDSVALVLDRELDVSRGDVLVRPEQPCRYERDARAMLCWFSPDALAVGSRLLLCSGTRTVKCAVQDIEYRVQVAGLTCEQTAELHTNDLASVRLKMQEPVAYDHYGEHREFGHFILVHPHSNETVAAGMFGGSLCDDWSDG